MTGPMLPQNDPRRAAHLKGYMRAWAQSKGINQEPPDDFVNAWAEYGDDEISKAFGQPFTGSRDWARQAQVANAGAQEQQYQDANSIGGRMGMMGRQLTGGALEVASSPLRFGAWAGGKVLPSGLGGDALSDYARNSTEQLRSGMVSEGEMDEMGMGNVGRWGMEVARSLPSAIPALGAARGTQLLPQVGKMGKLASGVTGEGIATAAGNAAQRFLPAAVRQGTGMGARVATGATRGAAGAVAAMPYENIAEGNAPMAALMGGGIGAALPLGARAAEQVAPWMNENIGQKVKGWWDSTRPAEAPGAAPSPDAMAQQIQQGAAAATPAAAPSATPGAAPAAPKFKTLATAGPEAAQKATAFFQTLPDEAARFKALKVGDKQLRDKEGRPSRTAILMQEISSGQKDLSALPEWMQQNLLEASGAVVAEPKKAMPKVPKAGKKGAETGQPTQVGDQVINPAPKSTVSGEVPVSAPKKGGAARGMDEIYTSAARDEKGNIDWDQLSFAERKKFTPHKDLQEMSLAQLAKALNGKHPGRVQAIIDKLGKSAEARAAGQAEAAGKSDERIKGYFETDDLSTITDEALENQILRIKNLKAKASDPKKVGVTMGKATVRLKQAESDLARFKRVRKGGGTTTAAAGGKADEVLSGDADEMAAALGEQPASPKAQVEALNKNVTQEAGPSYDDVDNAWTAMDENQRTLALLEDNASLSPDEAKRLAKFGSLVDTEVQADEDLIMQAISRKLAKEKGGDLAANLKAELEGAGGGPAEAKPFRKRRPQS